MQKLKQNIVWPKVAAMIITAALLTGITQCNTGPADKNTRQAEQSDSGVEALSFENRNCHEETFARFARKQTIIICIEDGIEIAMSTTQPGSNWMDQRYPMIVDSLRRIENWSAL